MPAATCHLPYTYLNAGTFNVSLTAGSDRGCTASVVKPITIAAGPVADFTVGPSCLNLATKFTDQSSGAIQSRNWQIGSSIFTTTNPTYTFTSTGDFPVTLTVSSANGCITVKTKTLTVPTQPSVNFNVSNLCAGKDALFSDATTSPQVGIGISMATQSLAIPLPMRFRLPVLSM